jgi:hypothetical protein
MNLRDRIALNHLLKLITNFVLSVLKILVPQNTEKTDPPKPKRKILPWRNKSE